MGGFNSGKGRGAEKVSAFLALDLVTLKKLGRSAPGDPFTLNWLSGDRTVAAVCMKVTTSNSLILRYRVRLRGTEDWSERREVIGFAQTPQHLGGFRRWLLCPKCSRRCRILYCAETFQCRRCRRAVYPGQYGPRYRIRDFRKYGSRALL